MWDQINVLRQIRKKKDFSRKISKIVKRYEIIFFVTDLLTFSKVKLSERVLVLRLANNGMKNGCYIVYTQHSPYWTSDLLQYRSAASFLLFEAVFRIIWSDPDPYQETIDMDPGSVKN